MRKTIYVFMFMAVVFTSCSKTEKIQLKGNVSGNVKIFAEDGYLMPDATVTVSIENTDFSTQTGTDGFFIIKDVPVGTYNLNFEGEGIESYTERGVNISSGPGIVLLEDIALGQKPLSVVNNLRAYDYFNTKIISGDLLPPGTENNRKLVRLYIKNEKDVSRKDYDFFVDIESVADTFYTYLSEIKYQHHYSEGTDSMYIVAHTKTFRPMGEYLDTYNFNYDEYGMNYMDYTVSEQASNVISIKIY